MLNGGLRICSPVGPGYFSPSNDNNRYLCPRGTYSDQDEAASCSICEAGSISNAGFAECSLCPSGFYQELPGQYYCKQCTPGYNGDGANNFSYNMESNILYCELTGVEPSMIPSVSPSASPTAQVSAVPSHWPSKNPSHSLSRDPSEASSQAPSQHPTVSPSRHASLRLSPSPSAIPPPTTTPAGLPSLPTQRSVAPVLTVLLVATLSVAALLIAAFVINLVRRRQQQHAPTGEHHKSEGPTTSNYDDLDDATFVRAVIQANQQGRADVKLSEKTGKHIPPNEIMVITDAIAIEVKPADIAIP